MCSSVILGFPSPTLPFLWFPRALSCFNLLARSQLMLPFSLRYLFFLSPWQTSIHVIRPSSSINPYEAFPKILLAPRRRDFCYLCAPLWYWLVTHLWQYFIAGLLALQCHIDALLLNADRDSVGLGWYLASTFLTSSQVSHTLRLRLYCIYLFLIPTPLCFPVYLLRTLSTL